MKNQLRFWKIPLSIICMVLLVLPLNTQAQTITSNQTGSQGGYTYEFWKDSGGSGSMTLGSGGAFSCQWSGINNILFRKGLRPGSRNQTVTYSANYNPSGNSYLCVYGWTTNPLVEYYIVESWGSWRPPGAQSVGTITTDGGTYELYRTQRVNQPSIQGTATFYQYWSVRTSKRTSGTITCANHFNAWESRGWNLGSLYEVSLTVEGYQSSGSANVTSMSMGTGSGGGGSNTIVVRARGTNGSEQIRLTVGGTTLNTWTLSTGYQNYTASTNNTGGINVEFINDASGRDVQVDYIQVNGSTRQAENQGTNTGVYQNGSCGGSNSEWMHCNGYIGFGNVSGGGGSGGGSSNAIVVRARGTNGSEQIRLTVGGATINTWTLSTSYQNFTANTSSTGGINVEFLNDASGRDVQVDYIQVNGSTRQAENQSTNTGVYQNGSCGGSNSEWLHCNGYIGFGNVSSSGRLSFSTPADLTAGLEERDVLFMSPNPVSSNGVLKVDLRGMKGVNHIALTDVSGRILNESRVENKDEAVVHLNGIHPGLYIIQVRNGPKRLIGKVLVK